MYVNKYAQICCVVGYVVPKCSPLADSCIDIMEGYIDHSYLVLICHTFIVQEIQTIIEYFSLKLFVILF